MKTHKLLQQLVPALLCSCMAHAAVADLIIWIPDTTIVAGSTSTINVMVSGSAPENQLRAYNFSFRLTPMTATTTLRFINPQADAQLSSPDYVFAGDSDAISNPGPGSFSTVHSQNLPNDTLTAGDVTDSLNTVTVLGTGHLLAALDILHFAPGDPETAVGQTFSLSLIADDGTFNSTFLSGTNSQIGFTASVGTITVVSMAAVPEPSTVGFLAVLLAFPAVRRYRNQHR